MAFKFNYARKLDQLEELVERRATGPLSGVWALVLALLRSRYFLISICIYLLLLLILGGVVVSHYVVTKATFDEGSVLILPSGPRGPPPPGPRGQPPGSQAAKQTRQVAVSVQTISSRAAAKTAAKRFTISAPSAFVRVEAPVVAPQIQMQDVKIDTQLAKTIAADNIRRLQGVREFQKGWNVTMGSGGSGGRGGGSGTGGGGTDGSGGGGAGSAGRGGKYAGIRAKFVIFQAKYQDGDWDCNGGADTNYWAQSSLKNLMFQIRQWSDNRVEAEVVPKVLDIGTDEIFTLKPPFIYLTGHKDFHFLDKEVKVLRDYLTQGGCVWADSALAGRHSRFDVAFRREIHKVLPDRDFEIVKPDHPMFNTRFADVDLPAGMNFYQEPIEVINIDEEMVVLYTPNGYGHFWESRLNRDGKIEWRRVNLSNIPGKPHWTWVYGYRHLFPPRWESGTLYRNMSDESVRDVYKFGINVVYHLLTQYQDKFKFLPRELPALEGMKKPEKKKEEEIQYYEPAGPAKVKKEHVHKKLGGGAATNEPAEKAAEKKDGKDKAKDK